MPRPNYCVVQERSCIVLESSDYDADDACETVGGDDEVVGDSMKSCRCSTWFQWKTFSSEWTDDCHVDDS